MPKDEPTKTPTAVALPAAPAEPANAVVKSETADQQALVKEFGDQPLDMKHMTLNQIRYIGMAMAQSGMFKDITSGPKALVKILAGQEIGVTPFQAMTNIHIIDGKATMGANLMAAMVKGSDRYDYRAKITPTEASISIFEKKKGVKGELLGEYSFTIQNATTAGIASKDVWRKYPENMLFARAISTAVRMYAPDVFNGNLVYTPEELNAEVDASGEVITDRKGQPVTEVSSKPTSVPPTERVETEDSKEAAAEVDEEPDVPAEVREAFPEAKAMPTTELKKTERASQALVEEIKRKFTEKGITEFRDKCEFCLEIIGKKIPASAADYKMIGDALDTLKPADEPTLVPEEENAA